MEISRHDCTSAAHQGSILLPGAFSRFPPATRRENETDKNDNHTADGVRRTGSSQNQKLLEGREAISSTAEARARKTAGSTWSQEAEPRSTGDCSTTSGRQFGEVIGSYEFLKKENVGVGLAYGVENWCSIA